jgi:hypothetical protein
MAIPKKELDELVIKLRDHDDQLFKMIDYIMHTANIGHSFEVVVDPDMREHRKTFYMDGDGSFYIQEVKKNNMKMKKLEEYLRFIQ